MDTIRRIHKLIDRFDWARRENAILIVDLRIELERTRVGRGCAEGTRLRRRPCDDFVRIFSVVCPLWFAIGRSWAPDLRDRGDWWNARGYDHRQLSDPVSFYVVEKLSAQKRELQGPKLSTPQETELN